MARRDTSILNLTRRLGTAALIRIAGTGVVALGGLTQSTQAQSFRGLGDLSGGAFESTAQGISAHGSIVVGASISGDFYQAFRWQSNVMTPLPGTTESVAHRCSSSGAVIAGYVNTFPGGGRAIPTIWTAGTPFSVTLPLSANNGTFQGLSGNGLVAVGYSNLGAVPYNALYWSAATGVVYLEDLDGTPFECVARATSNDGGVIVGTGNSGNGPIACRWLAPGYAPQSLGYVGESSDYSDAWDVTADGAAIVGASATDDGIVAYLHTGSQMTNLGDLAGGAVNSIALAIADNHNVIVGSGTTADGQRAFIWTPWSGMQDLRDVLVGLGVDMTGWTLREARDVSADGSTIVGTGINPDGMTEGWIATIPCFPGLQQPQDQSICCGRSAAFSVAADPIHGPATYQWQFFNGRRWENLTEGDSGGGYCGIVVGSTTERLSVAPASSLDQECLEVPLLEDGRQFRCIITNGCGTLTSNPATLHIACRADFNCDGFVDSSDFFAYLTAFFAGC